MIPVRIRIIENIARIGIMSRPTLFVVDVPEGLDENDLSEDYLFREVRDGYPKWAHFRCSSQRQWLWKDCRIFSVPTQVFCSQPVAPAPADNERPRIWPVAVGPGF